MKQSILEIGFCLTQPYKINLLVEGYPTLLTAI